MQPDIVGIHFKTGAYESVRHVARLTRTSSPKSLIIVGGPHPTVAPLETIRLPEIDIVVLGEGEITTSEIADRSSFDFEEKIPGALIKDNKGNIIDGGYRPFIEDLDDVGEPDREHLINHNKYSPYAFGVIFTARGCPYRCTYCVSKSIWSVK